MPKENKRLKYQKNPNLAKSTTKLRSGGTPASNSERQNHLTFLWTGFVSISQTYVSINGIVMGLAALVALSFELGLGLAITSVLGASLG